MTRTASALLTPVPEPDDPKLAEYHEYTDGETAVLCSNNAPSGAPCRGVAEWRIEVGPRKHHCCSIHFVSTCHWLASQYGRVHVTRSTLPECFAPSPRGCQTKDDQGCSPGHAARCPLHQGGNA